MYAGEFSLACSPLTIQRSDPIVSPGIASNHVHSIAGGNAFSRSMSDPLAATKSPQTSCNVDIDHSNYWVPALYHIDAGGTYTLVKYTGNNAYYFNRACDYTANPTVCDNINNNRSPRAFPAGFRMLAGDTTRRTYNASDFSHQAIAIMCANNPGIPDHEGPSMPTTPCQTFRAEVYFPSCWDGVNLDSANHKDHVSYPDYTHGNYQGGYCPKSHPVALFSLFYEFFFTTHDFPDTKFIFSNSDTTGYGLHGDFINGWTDLNVLQNAFNCIGDNCPINAPVANGGHRQGASTPQLVTPAVYEEDIGLTNPIRSLPNQGLTPTTSAPSSTPTGNKSWKSLGCYSDSVAARTLSFGQQIPGGPGALTLEACQSLCQKQGYTLAGVEYADECCMFVGFLTSFYASASYLFRTYC
ncbi:hypothetical protein F5884DRAFT_685979 [Xylogone sp. PMI_703]|nr:hypothetical protein F5884DRAFT_685979 [Xylogone sp. PMI_703]